MNLDNYLTMDINILLSIVNMKLRDEEGDIDALCHRYDMQQSALEQRLNDAGWHYVAKNNQFKQV
ncbi:DUF4250 domain-containing protein [Motilimonas eburnea]|uniref:DUF4250 domain-containing protein n=1 Tax=Motilimonas eburnea TaxID=1737488 RepID=UPI001E5C953E|nr:DUF4250 domain-containing protein [Motilimonas eburnea]MCE2570494.1 DUF4250 domain-containing protein [Motilimonas eburnea]